MINWRDTVISQYANSPILLTLLESANTWMDPSKNFDDFYNNIWDIDRAQGYGLDVWGRIVGISRTLRIPSDEKNFGFVINATSQDYTPFNEGVFSTGAETTQNYSLTDSAYRTLILFKAAANISDCSAISINRLLTSLFGERGRAYVTHSGTMEMTYVFEFVLRTYEKAVLENSDALIRPSGVLVNIVESPPAGFFGFKQMGAASRPFGEGIFYTNT